LGIQGYETAGPFQQCCACWRLRTGVLGQPRSGRESLMSDDTELWRVTIGARRIACLMRTCCSGAELQVVDGESIVLRELYPTKSDLYERARTLEAEYRDRDGVLP
jgi:hypothetical protein